MVISSCQGGVFIKNVTRFVASKIKALRENKNITQQELADAINTTQQSIARYESGERKADHNVLFSLAEYFNISIDELFPEKENKLDEHDELNFLFYKYRNLLTKDDEDTFKFILNKRKNEKETSKENK